MQLPPVSLVLLIGLPGSGKTTLASQLCQRAPSSLCVEHVEYDLLYDSLNDTAVGEDAFTVSGDATTQSEPTPPLASVHPDADCVATVDVFDALRWQQCRTLALQQVQQAIASAPSKERPCVLLLDDNFYYRSMRYVFFKLARLRKPIMMS